MTLTLLVRGLWFTEDTGDHKGAGFSGFSALQYELQHSLNNASGGGQVFPWLKFIFSMSAQWILMFALSCLPVAVFKRIGCFIKARHLIQSDNKSNH